MDEPLDLDRRYMVISAIQHEAMAFRAINDALLRLGAPMLLSEVEGAALRCERIADYLVFATQQEVSMSDETTSGFNFDKEKAVSEIQKMIWSASYLLDDLRQGGVPDDSKISELEKALQSVAKQIPYVRQYAEDHRRSERGDPVDPMENLSARAEELWSTLEDRFGKQVDAATEKLSKVLGSWAEKLTDTEKKRGSSLDD